MRHFVLEFDYTLASSPDWGWNVEPFVILNELVHLYKMSQHLVLLFYACGVFAANGHL